MTKTHLMKIYLLKIAQSLYINSNIQALLTELHKTKNALSPKLFAESFALKIPSILTVYYGSESISFSVSKTWNVLDNKIKQQASLNSFKKSVK